MSNDRIGSILEQGILKWGEMNPIPIEDGDYVYEEPLIVTIKEVEVTTVPNAYVSPLLQKGEPKIKVYITLSIDLENGDELEDALISAGNYIEKWCFPIFGLEERINCHGYFRYG